MMMMMGLTRVAVVGRDLRLRIWRPLKRLAGAGMVAAMPTVVLVLVLLVELAASLVVGWKIGRRIWSGMSG